MTQNNDWEGQFMKQCTMFETGCSFTPEVRVPVKNYQIIIDFIQTLLDQTKHDTVKEVIGKIDKLHDEYESEFHGGFDDPDTLLQREIALGDLTTQLRSEYKID